MKQIMCLILVLFSSQAFSGVIDRNPAEILHDMSPDFCFKFGKTVSKKHAWERDVTLESGIYKYMNKDETAIFIAKPGCDRETKGKVCDTYYGITIEVSRGWGGHEDSKMYPASCPKELKGQLLKARLKKGDEARFID